MKTKEIRDLSPEEAKEKLGEVKAELFNLRFQIATAKVDNPRRIREVKKDIARIKTILKEKQ
ncbi:MAG: 50S ribosomal protein L29 [Armatimonadetes bacterium CG07_land_8_20_14_0_80_40_9]|nr:MAG: 50S ribosomal protein L29 [Armatimonadetes bacterium CG07_land_8_20_14_0_80_40_9]